MSRAATDSVEQVRRSMASHFDGDSAYASVSRFRIDDCARTSNRTPRRRKNMAINREQFTGLAGRYGSRGPGAQGCCSPGRRLECGSRSMTAITGVAAAQSAAHVDARRGDSRERSHRGEHGVRCWISRRTSLPWRQLTPMSSSTTRSLQSRRSVACASEVCPPVRRGRTRRCELRRTRTTSAD